MCAPRRAGVFDALLPGWSSPVRVAAALLAWSLVDAALVAVVGRAGDRRALASGVGLAVLSAAGVAAVVRAHEGRTLADAALLARVALVGLATATV